MPDIKAIKRVVQQIREHAKLVSTGVSGMRLYLNEYADALEAALYEPRIDIQSTDIPSDDIEEREV
jgi:hypothetical protein